MPASEVFHKWKTGNLHSGSKHGPPVKSQKQAVAIYLSEKRAEAKHGGKYPEKAVGGPMMGGQNAPAQTVPSWPQNPNNWAGATGRAEVERPMGIAGPDEDRSMGVAGPSGYQGGMSGMGGMGNPFQGGNPASWQVALSKMFPNAPNMQMPTNPDPMRQPIGVAGAMPTSPRPMAIGGVANMGVGDFNVAKQPHLNPSYMEKSEMRNVMHGPVMSSVPGRTDAHKTAVPSGSYVVPADVVSGRGQGNTMAGMQSLQRAFRMGPYGSPGGTIRPGRTMPGPMRAPKPMNVMASGGGKHGDHVGKPVPVNIAGGELVVPPENVLETVRRITKNPAHTLATAHNVLDKWVVNERKKHRATLAKLPGPVKD